MSPYFCRRFIFLGLIFKKKVKTGEKKNQTTPLSSVCSSCRETITYILVMTDICEKELMGLSQMLFLYYSEQTSFCRLSLISV